MTPTTFQLARHLNHTRQIVTGQRCPCGNKAVKKDGASWVCKECLRRDKVADDMLEHVHRDRGHLRLSSERFVVAKEKMRVSHWKYRQRVKKGKS